MIDWMWGIWKSKELKVTPGLWAQANVETMALFSGVEHQGDCAQVGLVNTGWIEMGLQPLGGCHIPLPSHREVELWAWRAPDQ